MQGLRKRHHYGTTGSRVVLDVRAVFDKPAEGFSDDPKLGDVTSKTGQRGDDGRHPKIRRRRGDV